MALVIRKRVDLDFLGEDYKESYITFKAIPIKDFELIQKTQSEIGEDNIKALHFILENLKKYFIEGKGIDENKKVIDLVIDDIGELDQASIIKCFQALTGIGVNEESDFLDKESNKPSSTTEASQSKS